MAEIRQSTSVFALLASVVGSLTHVGCSNWLGASKASPGGYEEPETPFIGIVDVPLLAGSSTSGIVNLGLPVPPGAVRDADNVFVSIGGIPVAVASRGLAPYGDGSFRAIEIQVEVIDTPGTLHVEVGRAPFGRRELVPVTDTLSNGLPRIWARVPDWFLAQSGLLGPIEPASRATGSLRDAWLRVCDYAAWDTSAFMARADDREVWLYDRVTANYRGSAFASSDVAWRSAMAEAELYRAGIVINSDGLATAIAVPGALDDLKYHYVQGMAIHYLLTGDERFRDSALAVARRAHELWPEPGYDGSDDFWTERHAAFALLAYDWAARLSDDPEFADHADAAVDAYLAVQRDYPAADEGARCFAHTGAAHGEDWAGWGCSPWMSAILADALDGYARRVGGARADEIAGALVGLGRAVAQDGRDGEGRPYYFMATDGADHQVDPDDEHWGEAAYVVALAWQLGGKQTESLYDAALALTEGFAERATVPHVRSFNWQCRSAIATSALLQ